MSEDSTAESSLTGSDSDVNCKAKIEKDKDKEPERKRLNEKEKNRMTKLAQQIQHLKKVLDNAGITCKRSKQSILSSTTSYIEELESELKRVKEELQEKKEEKVADNYEDTFPVLFDTSFGPDAKKMLVTPVVPHGDYSLMFEKAGLPMAIWKLDGGFAHCNEAFLNFSGFQMEELQCISFFQLTMPEDKQELVNLVSSLMLPNSSSTMYLWKKCTLKNVVTSVYVAMSLIKDELEQPKYFHCVTMIMPTAPPKYALPTRANVGQYQDSTNVSLEAEDLDELLNL